MYEELLRQEEQERTRLGLTAGSTLSVRSLGAAAQENMLAFEQARMGRIRESQEREMKQVLQRELEAAER